VKAFFQKHYRPKNASIAIAGDVDTTEALVLVDDYFGEIDGGGDVPPFRAVKPAPPTAEIRLLHEDRVELPRLYLAWHSPALFAETDAELDLVADLLSSGKTSRLYRSLVYEHRIATEIAASQNSREAGGFFQVAATAAPGRTLAELDRAISAEIDAIATKGPVEAEMERALAQAEAHFIYRLQTVGGFGGKSDQLNAYNVYLGDPGFFERDLARYRNVTADALKRAAAEWLRPDRRVALSVVPRGRIALALPNSAPVTVS
jgi:zinc protease